MSLQGKSPTPSHLDLDGVCGADHHAKPGEIRIKECRCALRFGPERDLNPHVLRATNELPPPPHPKYKRCDFLKSERESLYKEFKGFNTGQKSGIVSLT